MNYRAEILIEVDPEKRWAFWKKVGDFVFEKNKEESFNILEPYISGLKNVFIDVSSCNEENLRMQIRTLAKFCWEHQEVETFTADIQMNYQDLFFNRTDSPLET